MSKKSSRRQFLKTSTVLTAGAAIAGAHIGQVCGIEIEATTGAGELQTIMSNSMKDVGLAIGTDDLVALDGIWAIGVLVKW